MMWLFGFNHSENILSKKEAPIVIMFIRVFACEIFYFSLTLVHVSTIYKVFLIIMVFIMQNVNMTTKNIRLPFFRFASLFIF